MKDVRTWLIIGLAAVIVLLILFQPSKPDEQDTRKYDSLIRVAREGEAKAKEQSELRKAAEQKTIQTKKSYDSLKKSSVAQIAYYRAHPKVIEIIREVPIIDSAFRAYDSAIVIRDDRIVELSGELYNCQKMASNAEENFQATLQAQHGANDELVEDNQDLKKDLRKERKRGRGWKALAVVGTVLGFIGGSQL